MNALEEYQSVRHDINHGELPPFSGEQMTRIRDAADAAIAELEQENERLRCCGNCGHEDEEVLSETPCGLCRPNPETHDSPSFCAAREETP